MNRHGHEKARQKHGEHIPEEVLHGCILLSENAPTRKLQQNRPDLSMYLLLSAAREASFRLI